MAAQLIAAAGLGALQIVNGLHQAETIQRQGELTRQVNEFNARQAELDAYEAEKFGFTETARYENIVNNVLSDQKLAFAANNIDANFGTAAQIQEESKLNGFLNALDIKAQGRARARGFKREARQIRLQGSMQSSQTNINSRAAVTSGILSAANTAASAGADYYKGTK